MDRRNFLKTAGASTTVYFAGLGIQLTQAGSEMPAHQPSDDARLRVLQYAIRAPNSHNAQPWRIDLTPDLGMDLSVDRSRLLPATDPSARQIHISQGTFLELLDIAARQFGYAAEMRYFPDGEYSSDSIDDRRVAAITLGPDPSVAPDPLFPEIRRRQTNRRRYNFAGPLSAAEWTAIQSAPRTKNLRWRVTADEAQRDAIAGICQDAMRIEVSSPARNRETAGWFRFSDPELRQNRDGFGLAQSGTEGIKKWIAETFVLDRERAANPKGAFAQGAIASLAEQAGSAAAFAALATATNTRLQQVLAGRAYARVHLTASRLGLAMQPLSQALEEYAEMAAPQQQIKQALNIADAHTVQMLFRLGHARPTPYSPRRDIAALIRQRPASENRTMGPSEG
ncbi:MAG: nitroreductase family protein [Acidobacteriota bacterium]|nr:nitroreductase family protein [Acidobacteriota bacterium]